MELDPAERPHNKKLRVVIADDSLSLRQMLVLLCERVPGLEIVGEAADGVQAVETVRRLQPDLLILDLQMPGLGGLDVLQAVKAAPSPPVIILWTGLPAEMYGDTWRAMGVRYFFHKGREVNELTQALRDLAADAGH